MGEAMSWISRRFINEFCFCIKKYRKTKDPANLKDFWLFTKYYIDEANKKIKSRLAATRRLKK